MPSSDGDAGRATSSGPDIPGVLLFQIHMPIKENIESENKIESMLKAQGFEDALCYLSDSSANIIVKTPGLDAAGAAKIKSTLLSEAEFTNDQITIVEVN